MYLMCKLTTFSYRMFWDSEWSVWCVVGVRVGTVGSRGIEKSQLRGVKSVIPDRIWNRLESSGRAERDLNCV